MSRALTLRNLYDKKFKTLAFTADWQKAFGNPEHNGIWLIFGKDKNGKTTMALKLVEILSVADRVLYVSAEEGFAKAFRDTCKRVGLDAGNKRIHFVEYLPIEELEERLKTRKCPRILFIDNLSIYMDELKGKKLIELSRRYPQKLFIYLAHEERNEPYGSAARMAKKWAKIIVHVKGLSAFISGRCPGGVMTIDEAKAKIYWGNSITNQE